MSITEQNRRAIVTVPESKKTVEDDLEGVRYRLILSLSPEMHERIEKLANRNHMDKGELINMAVGLLNLLSDAVAEGKKVGVADADSELETEITDI